MMKRAPPAANPDAYVRALRGWRRDLVVSLRDAVLGAAKFEEQIKWGHIVFFHNGPTLLIRAEEERVLFGFWRGKRLVDIEPRLKPGGKYEMATIDLRKGDTLDASIAVRLARQAAKLNRTVGNPAARS